MECVTHLTGSTRLVRAESVFIKHTPAVDSLLMAGPFPGPNDLPSQHGAVTTARRSEEHTSELQSRQYLVCRLLLEKKKKYTNNILVNSINYVLAHSDNTTSSL